MTKRNLTVYIGRFSPWHKEHAATALRALRLSRKVLIIIGSARQPRTIKNPWKSQERAEYIRAWYDTQLFTQLPDSLGELIIVEQRDHPYNHQQWLADVQAKVADAAEGGDVYITGSDRDDSTFYLKEFPSYLNDFVHEGRELRPYLSGTSIRDLYFGQKLNSRPLSPAEVSELNNVFLPPTTSEFLENFRQSPDYEMLVEEYKFQEGHDKMWAGAPYTPTFNTSDAVVIQTGHILLVKRRSTPGRGLWALPGGYIKPNEWRIDAAIRELYEETKIDLPEKVLRGCLVDEYEFEDPNRSIRGRIITKAFLFKLNERVIDGRIKLPKVKGSDDAEKAKWFPLSEVFNMGEVLFEDHLAIIETMIARLRVRENR